MAEAGESGEISLPRLPYIVGPDGQCAFRWVDSASGEMETFCEGRYGTSLFQVDFDGPSCVRCRAELAKEILGGPREGRYALT